MGIKSSSLIENPTSITVTGGTALAFTEDGEEVKNGVHTSAASVADFRVRPSIVAKNRNPVNRNGVFSKGKRWLTLISPQLLDDETYVHNVIRIEVEMHPEMTGAEVKSFLDLGSQLMFDTDYRTFLETGSLA